MSLSTDGYGPGNWFLLSFGYPEKPEALTLAKRAGGWKPPEVIVHEERWRRLLEPHHAIVREARPGK